MVRIPVRLFIFSLLFASPAIAQSSWLHPSDREYQFAIDAAFGDAKAGRESAEVLEFIRPLSDGASSYVSIRPPLACANVNAEAKRREFAIPPTVDEVKKECDGQLLVAVRYFSPVLEADRSLVVEHGEQEIKPSRTFFDRAHPVTVVDDLTGSKQVQYAYLDLYFVVPDAAWGDNVEFVAPDENGKQSTLTFNFSSQIENEQQIDSASRQ